MSAPYLVLIVEDNKVYAETLKRTVERLLPDVKVHIHPHNFEGALDELHSLRPDIFIVDLYEGEYTQTSIPTGPELCKKIWDRRFRPLIVNSAFDDDPHIDHRLAKHPFYKYIGKKAADCADQVAIQVKEFLNHVVALHQVEDEVHRVLQTVLQDTMEAIWPTQTDPSARIQMILRSARRRVGAMMDLKPLLSTENVFPWEQYIVPPLEADLLMGDVLRQRETASSDASAYRVVLTPSCDLVLRNGKAKVQAALAGRCINAKSYVEVLLPNITKPSEIKKRLQSRLTEPQVSGYCPLPAYPGLWPNMAINLRSVELVGLDQILDKTGGQFERIASIDSPFREHVAWAYMQIAARPGIPDRETDLWIDSIIKDLG